MIIDRFLNYGRRYIETFLRASSPFCSVLDVGAGAGEDLLLAKLFPNMAVGIFMLFKKQKPYTGFFIKWPNLQQMETHFYLG